MLLIHLTVMLTSHAGFVEPSFTTVNLALGQYSPLKPRVHHRLECRLWSTSLRASTSPLPPRHSCSRCHWNFSFILECQSPLFTTMYIKKNYQIARGCHDKKIHVTQKN
ncbi:unnamed protein product [Musa textilis]